MHFSHAPSALSLSRTETTERGGSHAKIFGTGITAIRHGLGKTARAVTAGILRKNFLTLDTGSRAKTGMAIAKAATLHGTGMTAGRVIGSGTAMATGAFISGIGTPHKGCSSTPSSTFKSATGAVIHGTSMTASTSGGRRTAWATLMAGGTGRRGSAWTASTTATTAGTTGSPPPNGGDGAPTAAPVACVAPTEQNYFATVHLAAESTCASYLASAIRPSAERMPGGALFIL